jgi:hypothetical protein
VTIAASGKSNSFVHSLDRGLFAVAFAFLYPRMFGSIEVCRSRPQPRRFAGSGSISGPQVETTLVMDGAIIAGSPPNSGVSKEAAPKAGHRQEDDGNIRNREGQSTEIASTRSSHRKLAQGQSE